MRISDWSSDVCSSDLKWRIMEDDDSSPFDFFHALQVWNDVEGRYAFPCLPQTVIDIAATKFCPGPDDFDLSLPLVRFMGPEPGESDIPIGRASCRERVCQSV